jgi:predicted CopG family antitoxin
MSLKNWRNNGWLKDHKTSLQEITDLLAVSERDLKDSSAPGLSPDWQLAIAYNAALQAATAALFASGYRAGREAHHYRIIQSLAHTIQAKSDLINQLDKFRKKRNIGGYEAAGRISQQEADEMKKLAKDLYEQIVKWLHQHHANLMTKK